mmetsp:Transcript_18447/g.47299  ORF Transcript_18447/g.47299 Transcript_18447/m.47299 type:complete len:225 (+) Transcript_18447:507-1181(+)
MCLPAHYSSRYIRASRRRLQSCPGNPVRASMHSPRLSARSAGRKQLSTSKSCANLTPSIISPTGPTGLKSMRRFARATHTRCTRTPSSAGRCLCSVDVTAHLASPQSPSTKTLASPPRKSERSLPNPSWSSSHPLWPRPRFRQRWACRSFASPPTSRRLSASNLSSSDHANDTLRSAAAVQPHRVHIRHRAPRRIRSRGTRPPLVCARCVLESVRAAPGLRLSG